MADPTLPAVKDRLLALIAARPAFVGPPSVQVCDAHPGANALRREALIIGGSEDGATEWAAIGGRGEGERYSLQLDVVVGAPGLTAKQCRDRAWTLYADVHTLLRADPTLGLVLAGVKSMVVEIEWRRFIEVPDKEGHLAAIEGSFTVAARI